MMSNHSVRLRILAVFSAILCICCVGIVVVDIEMDAGPTDDPFGGDDPGTSTNPIHISSDSLIGTFQDFVSEYEQYLTGRSEVYFEFDSGSSVNLYNESEMYFTFIVKDIGTLQIEQGGLRIIGTATTDFTIEVANDLGIHSILYFIAVEPELGSEQNPYTGEATIPLVDGGEVWVEVDTYVQFDVGRNSYGFDGFEGSGLMNVGHALYGTVTTPGDYEIQYGSAGASDVPVYDYVFTLHVVGDVMLEFLSDPTDPLFATITFSKP